MLEITSDAGAEIFGLSDVEDLFGRAFHEVKARAGRKALYFFADCLEFIERFLWHMFNLNIVVRLSKTDWLNVKKFFLFIDSVATRTNDRIKNFVPEFLIFRLYRCSNRK